MKKGMAILMALLLLTTTALGEFFVAGDGAGGIFFYDGDGIRYLSGDGALSTVYEGRVGEGMGCIDGALIFVAAEGEEYDDIAAETLMRVTKDGATSPLAPRLELRSDWDYEARGEGGEVALTHYVGYHDMSVCDGMIYYIGNNGRSGSYETISTMYYDGGEEHIMTRFDSGLSLYRLDPDSGEVSELVADIGNSAGAHFALGGGRIAVASCLSNPEYAYDFTNFTLHDMDGALVKSFRDAAASRADSLYDACHAKGCEFTVIVLGLQTDGKKIWFSSGDSEGDFASSRLIDLDKPEATLGYEAYNVRSVVMPEGVYRMASDVEDVFYDEGMEESCRLSFFDADGEHRLMKIPAECEPWDFRFALVDGTVYAVAGGRLIRVCPDGLPEALTWAGTFEYAPGFDPNAEEADEDV